MFLWGEKTTRWKVAYTENENYCQNILLELSTIFACRNSRYTECVFSTTDLIAVLAEARFLFCMTQTDDIFFSQLRCDSTLIAVNAVLDVLV